MITHEIAGVVYAKQQDVLEQLGDDVTPGMLREWSRTRGVKRVRLGREVWWDLHAAIEAEHEARTSRRGRPRKAHLNRRRESGGMTRAAMVR